MTQNLQLLLSYSYDDLPACQPCQLISICLSAPSLRTYFLKNLGISQPSDMQCR